MRRGIREWKTLAKEALSGNYGSAILAIVVVTGVTFLSSIFGGSLFQGTSVFEIVIGQVFLFILSLVMSVFSAGLSYMYLNIARRRQYSMADLLYFFRSQPDRVIIAGFVLALIEVVVSIPYYYVSYFTEPAGTTLEAQMMWMEKTMGFMLLSVALNLLVTIPFSLTYFLLADDVQMGGLEALKESVRLMKGHIGKYLLLQLSFVPLFLLTVFTLYIGLLWLLPYMQMAEVIFYLDRIGELDAETPKEITPVYTLPSGDDYNSEA